MNRKIKAVLFFSICFFASILQAKEVTLPLPQDAIMVSKQGPFFGSMKTVDSIYKSSMNESKLRVFYKKEMIKEGWEENEDLIFTKDDDIAIIAVDLSKDMAGKTIFMISASKMLQDEDASDMPKKNPDKLNFMPIYPGSQQNYFWYLPHGAAGEYETNNSIKEVAFFYKSAMLNYGWRLDTEEQNLTGTGLTFSRGNNETCEIVISDIPVDKNNLPQNKTTIEVSYYEHKPIKK